MSIELPLDQMTLADKLEAMERLWADISTVPAAVPSPAWHRDILAERKRLAAEGKVKFLDWDTAISQLRDELRANSPS
ncbi:MAG: addiction module protein [Planctomycetia bacterium]|nr:addiction module protein [Planctomycetia bacterium]